MSNSAKGLAVPVLIVAVGVGWLLNSLGVLPGVNWVWTAGLAVLGIVAIACGGLNKVTIVVGPWLLIASVLSVMGQTGKLSIDVEVPCLVIVLGLLMVVAKLSPLPIPDWILEDQKP